MGVSLLAGVAGLRSHQRMLDITANNLANINTPGFKSSNVTFSDLFSQTLDTGAAGTETLGGRNSIQLGMGVKTAGINTNFEQGSLSATGRTFDLAIEGEGFFALSDGSQSVFTRVGTFDVDASNKLVHLGTGFRVLDATGSDITIPRNVTLPGQLSSTVDIVGNLNANAAGPQAEQLGTAVPFMTTTATAVSSAAGPYTLSEGDTLSITANDGNEPQTFTFTAADFTAIGADIANCTAGEVAQVINATATNFEASARDGRLILKSLSSTSASSLTIAESVGTPAAALGLETGYHDRSAYASSDLRDLDSNIVDYIDGDTISITGTDMDGTQVAGTFTFGAANDGTTLGDLMTVIGSTYNGCTAALDAAGNITLTANSVGETDLFLTLSDGAANTGGTVFTNHSFQTEAQGGLGDTRATSIKVFDAMGGSHIVTVTFRKTGANQWNATASLEEGDGTVLDGRIDGIVFGEDGSYSQITGTGEGDPGFEFRFNGIASAQTLHLDLGTSGGFDGLTQYGSDYSAAAISQDGFGPGSLESVSIKADGTIQGNFSNGKITDIAQLQIATFSNPSGLLKQGDNLYLPGANSGPAVAGTALTAGAGRISSSSIEGSNVDIALEFTRLITAQRGYQVNARTITTADQMMQELANLVR